MTVLISMSTVKCLLGRITIRPPKGSIIAAISGFHHCELLWVMGKFT